MSGRSHAIPLGSAVLTVLLALYILLPLLDVSALGLTDQDEGYYASVARGMIRTGDYLSPRFAGELWFKKPPLLYWLMAGSMRIFGPNEFAVRLPSILAYWAIIAMLVIWGNRRLGRSTGGYAALLFAASPMALALSRTAFMDTLLTACLTAALLAMWESARRPVFCVVSGVATGLAMLAKGPLALAVIGLQLLLTLPLLRGRGLKGRHVIAAIAAATLVLAPWYVGVYLQHGSRFFHEFIVNENLLRFAGGDAPHAVTNPVLYLLFYVAVIWLGMFPASTVLPSVSVSSGDTSAFLGRWCWLVLALFTLAVTKLPAYILPLFPAASLLAADSLVRTDAGRRMLLLRQSILALGAAAWLAGSIYLSTLLHSPPIVLLGVGLSAMTALIAWPRRAAMDHAAPVSARKWWHAPAPYAALGAVACLAGFHMAFRAYDTAELRPVRSLALQVPRNAELLTYMMPLERPSLDFYRDGHVRDTDDPQTVLGCLARGGYCITIPNALPEHGTGVLQRVNTLRESYILAHGGFRP